MTNTKQLKEIINKLIEKGYGEFEITDAEILYTVGNTNFRMVANLE